MADREPQDQDKFVIRLPGGMRDRIRLEAQKSGVSMNALMVETLEQKFPVPPTQSLQEFVRELQALAAALGPESSIFEIDAAMREIDHTSHKIKEAVHMMRQGGFFQDNG